MHCIHTEAFADELTLCLGFALLSTQTMGNLRISETLLENIYG